jgi:hypothetical protein
MQKNINFQLKANSMRKEIFGKKCNWDLYPRQLANFLDTFILDTLTPKGLLDLQALFS